jgi:hypothetical protein
MTPPVQPAGLTTQQHIEIVERLVRMETLMVSMNERMGDWQTRHEKEDEEVHKLVKTHATRLDSHDTFRARVYGGLALISALLTALGGYAAKAGTALPILFGMK